MKVYIQNTIKSIVESNGVVLDGLVKVTEISQVSSEVKKVDGKDVKVVALNSTTARVTIEIDEWETLNFSITYYVMGNQDHSVTVC